MNYYDYRSYFQELTEDTETIIEHQEEIKNQNTEIIELNSILAFSLILYIIITFVRRLFNKR